VGHWWRWALRAVALLAFGGAGLQLALHPTPHYPPPGSQTIHWCLSPFDRLKGETDRNEVPFFHSVSPAQLQYLLAAVSTCDAATRCYRPEYLRTTVGIPARIFGDGFSFGI